MCSRRHRLLGKKRKLACCVLDVYNELRIDFWFSHQVNGIIFTKTISFTATRTNCVETAVKSFCAPYERTVATCMCTAL